eukprot:530680-Amorphochlora_amoeboformis.AAC.1
MTREAGPGSFCVLFRFSGAVFGLFWATAAPSPAGRGFRQIGQSFAAHWFICAHSGHVHVEPERDKIRLGIGKGNASHQQNPWPRTTPSFF